MILKKEVSPFNEKIDHFIKVYPIYKFKNDTFDFILTDPLISELNLQAELDLKGPRGNIQLLNQNNFSTFKINGIRTSFCN
mmetsp:Transcript_78303/g.169281  ORF Transcript_78303/g.169281 Transcript_78303/m.169281 type:complete len:81 (+) Transcript_78303:476-718(+)